MFHQFLCCAAQLQVGLAYGLVLGAGAGQSKRFFSTGYSWSIWYTFTTLPTIVSRRAHAEVFEVDQMPLFQKGARLGSGAAPERWQVIKKLGEGQFAEVYEVRDMTVKERDARVSECII